MKAMVNYLTSPEKGNELRNPAKDSFIPSLHTRNIRRNQIHNVSDDTASYSQEDHAIDLDLVWAHGLQAAV